VLSVGGIFRGLGVAAAAGSLRLLGSVEDGVQVGRAGAWLKRQDPAAVLAEVKVLEDVEGCGRNSGKVDDRRRVLSGPVSGRQDAHAEIGQLAKRLCGVLKVVLELLVDRVGERHVLEHAFELGGELAAALRLELADHHLLGVVGSGLLVEQPPGEMPLVILLEGVLLLEESVVNFIKLCRNKYRNYKFPKNGHNYYR